MSERTVITEPAPLNAYRQFPYTVTPFPLDWLQRFTSLGDLPDPIPPAPDSPQPLE